MRSFIAAAPLLAIVAGKTTSYGTTLVPEISGSVTITSTYTYSNLETSFLTETNSQGVVTGMPAGASGTQPAVVTSQPPVASVPAGLPAGITTLFYGNSSFVVSVGSSTTAIIGGAASSASITAGSSAGVAHPSSGGHHGGQNGGGHHSGKQQGSSSAAASASSSTSSGAAAPTNMKAASAGIIGLGAFFAALL